MTKISELVRNSQDKDILVIGDFVLDQYLEVEKFVHEVDADPFGLEYVWQNQVDTIGGAGIVARQCKEICPNVSCIGVAGTDVAGKELTEDFTKHQINFVNIVHQLHGKEEIASPFRERIFRGPNRQILKLMRNGYTGQSLLELLDYSDILSGSLHDLPRLPDMMFLCDFSQGLFTQNVVYQLSHSVALRNKAIVLKARQWKDIYQVLPVNLLFLDADHSWLVGHDDLCVAEREISNIAKKFNHPLSVICNLRNHGCALFEFRPSQDTKQNTLNRKVHIENAMSRVGLFSAVTALVGLLCYGGNPSKDNFFDDAISLISSIERATIPWEYQVASLDSIKNWQSTSTTQKAKGDLPDIPARAIKILFLAANPSNVTRLRLDAEIREIDRALQQTKYRDLFVIEQQHAVRVTDLQGHLLRHKPDIVHFSGHGSEQSDLVLEDNFGNSQPVSVRALSQLFSVLKDNIRCVVLNACYSEDQARAIAQHIDCVVGMSRAIKDASAISFAAAFYQALGFGKDIETAFTLGCSQIDLENLGEQDTPKLLATKSDPREIIFAKED